MWNQITNCVGGSNSCVIERGGHNWFFSERVSYFLEENNGVDTERKDEDPGKCESPMN
jgi:hypothetical protein